MLTFCNRHNQTVWVSIIRYTPNCPDGGDWTKEGWWGIEPGQCKIVYGGDLQKVNRYFYYYAETAGGVIWTGPIFTFVPIQPFSWCLATANTSSRSVGFRLLDIEHYNNFTLSLW